MKVIRGTAKLSQQHVSPKFMLNAFNCPFCGVYAMFKWRDMEQSRSATNTFRKNEIHVGKCSHCNEETFWLKQGQPAKVTMLYPGEAGAAMPNADMPPEAKTLYEEARLVQSHSPRAAAALLRICIEQLIFGVGGDGNLDAVVAQLVRDGMPAQIQKGIEMVRITGSGALVPAGQIQLQEQLEAIPILFALANLIVENRITQPKEISKAFQAMPTVSPGSKA